MHSLYLHDMHTKWSIQLARLPIQETYYYVNQGSKLMTDGITADSTAVKGVDKGNKELVEALTCEGGVLAVGALPAPDAATAEGQKNLLEAMAGAVGDAPQKKSKQTSTPTEPAAPKTFEESLVLSTKGSDVHSQYRKQTNVRSEFGESMMLENHTYGY